jgi:hypothetical protein
MGQDRLHLVLVCHTEADFQGGWKTFEKFQPKIDGMIQRVADATGKVPKITYCLTGEFIEDKIECVWPWIDQGHEIGVHSHVLGSHRHNHSYKPPYDYREDVNGVLNQNRFAQPFRSMLIAHGVPDPVTHVSGMFTFRDSTVRLLEGAGFEVDCSLLPGVRGKHWATGDFILCDNRQRKSGKPYHPSYADHCKEGRAKLVELPVSGWLGGDNLLTTQATDLKKRLTSNADVDIFQMYWHHYEFAHEELDWVKGNLDEAEQFLIRFGLIDSVRFSTAKEAVDDWKDQRS